MTQPALAALHICNYKRFPYLELELHPVTVIAGANGSGKTQILWAILIFLRSYNTRFNESQHVISQTFALGTQHMYELTGNPYFQKLCKL
jgi:recombinational DNA repair ATPase RecF